MWQAWLLSCSVAEELSVEVTGAFAGTGWLWTWCRVAGVAGRADDPAVAKVASRVRQQQHQHQRSDSECVTNCKKQVHLHWTFAAKL